VKIRCATAPSRLQEATNHPAQNRYRNRGLSAAEIKACRGISPEVGGGESEKVGDELAAAESAGVSESLA